MARRSVDRSGREAAGRREAARPGGEGAAIGGMIGAAERAPGRFRSFRYIDTIYRYRTVWVGRCQDVTLATRCALPNAPRTTGPSVVSRGRVGRRSACRGRRREPSAACRGVRSAVGRVPRCARTVAGYIWPQEDAHERRGLSTRERVSTHRVFTGSPCRQCAVPGRADAAQPGWLHRRTRRHPRSGRESVRQPEGGARRMRLQPRVGCQSDHVHDRRRVSERHLGGACRGVCVGTPSVREHRGGGQELDEPRVDGGSRGHSPD